MTDLNATWNETLRGPRMSETTGRVIFKYQMPVLEQFTMELPQGAKVLRVKDENGMFWMWAEVNTNRPNETRHFRAFKTGAAIPDSIELNYIGFCAIFVQMELGLYIYEEVQAARTYPSIDSWKKVTEIAEKLGKPVVDVKLSQMDPSDMAGLPSYILKGPAGTTFNWPKMMSDYLGYDIYSKPPEGTKARYIMDIDQVLSDFEDVFRPMFEAKSRKPMSQRRIDEIEAQGGFEEEEAE